MVGRSKKCAAVAAVAALAARLLFQCAWLEAFTFNPIRCPGWFRDASQLARRGETTPAFRVSAKGEEGAVAEEAVAEENASSAYTPTIASLRDEQQFEQALEHFDQLLRWGVALSPEEYQAAITCAKALDNPEKSKAIAQQLRESLLNRRRAGRRGAPRRTLSGNVSQPEAAPKRGRFWTAARARTWDDVERAAGRLSEEKPDEARPGPRSAAERGMLSERPVQPPRTGLSEEDEEYTLPFERELF